MTAALPKKEERAEPLEHRIKPWEEEPSKQPVSSSTN
jgi:hypothetical protein